MKAKYWLCQRKEIYFSFDSATGKRESLHTGNREEAQKIIRARNDAASQPALNVSIAKAYLIGTDPKLVERTWDFVMREFCANKKENSIAQHNLLEITVASLWPNQLIGDLNLPVEKRLAWTTINPFKKDSPLLMSGLIGPVEIQAVVAAQ